MSLTRSPRSGRRRRIHWNAVKSRVVRAAERSAGALPDSVAAPLLGAAEAVANAAWFAPGVPMRHACRDIARLASARGFEHDAYAIHRRLVAQMRAVWITVERGEVWVELGDPIREADPERALQDAIARLEEWILRDPGSWAFLADRRWRRVMRRAKK